MSSLFHCRLLILAALVLTAPSQDIRAAVVVRSFIPFLAPNLKSFSGDNGPGFIINGKLYLFDWLAGPAGLDIDSNGTDDMIVTGIPFGVGPVTAMEVSLFGLNQVWSRVGGAGGLDVGSFAVALAGGTLLGPTLTSTDPQTGWHNDVDTGAPSLLKGSTQNGAHLDGDFYTQYADDLPKYLGFRFAGAGGIHYGWMAITGFEGRDLEFYVSKWAYGSEPNRGLIVGQVPEPGGAVLLALAATAYLVPRRRVHVESQRL